MGNLAEIAIECDERSPLGRAYLEQILVGDTVKILIPHGHHIMAACLQALPPQTLGSMMMRFSSVFMFGRA